MSPLISVADALAALERGAAGFADCRFELARPDAGEAAYAASHVPGARYVHLERDLSGPIEPGRTGRHPLPDRERFAWTVARLGLTAAPLLVAYDDAGGAIAARLWWMMRWAGWDAVSVLDGGWRAWLETGAPTSAAAPAPVEAPFRPRWRPERVAGASAVAALVEGTAAGALLDARAADRFAGENERIDPVAGHIPTARSAPFAGNLGPDGRFLERAALRARYERLLGDTPPREVVAYCGSGVTACHDLLAMEHAGLGGARLYAGSWSEWITDPRRPTARGPEPR